MWVMPLSRTESAERSSTGGRAVIPVPMADWRRDGVRLPGARADLRTVEPGDAPAFLELFASDDVWRFGTAPAATIEAFERFIEWSTSEREAGRHICLAVVPHGCAAPVGLFQVRQLEPAFKTAEWGFVLGAAFWGTGLFIDAAPLVLDFVFGALGAHRVEARAVAANGRGNGALQKLGAVQEGVLRRAFLREGQYVDQVLWSILDEDWRRTREAWPRRVLVH